MLKLISRLSSSKCSVRLFSQVNKVNESDEIMDSKKNPIDVKTKTERKKSLTVMLDYFKNSETFVKNLDKIPKKLLKRKDRSDYLYLFDDKTADVIINHFSSDLVESGAPVYECCPGFGAMTERLIRAGVKQIRTFEMDSVFRDHAAVIQEKYPEVITLYNNNFLQLWKLVFQDLMDKGDRLESLMEGIQVKNWEDDCVVSIIGAVGSSTFLHHIIYSIIYKNALVSWGRPDMFLILPPTILLQLKQVSESKYQNIAFTSLFSLLLDIHVYGTVERNAYLPWQSNKAQLEKMCRSFDLDINKLYLTRLTPKRDLYQLIPPDNMKLLYFFIKRHLSSRSNRVIPCLEQWIPGCGPRLVNMGYSVFTRFADLNSDQMLQLFLTFISWPEFPSCSFFPAMETTMMKMEQPSLIEPDSEILDAGHMEPSHSQDDVYIPS